MDTLAAYLFVKRFLAHAADGHVSHDEENAMRAQMAQAGRRLGQTPAQRRASWNEAQATYDVLLATSGPGAVVREFHRCIDQVTTDLEAHPEVLAELAMACNQLVAADGAIDPMEGHFVALVAAAWQSRMPATHHPIDLVEAYLFIKRFLAEVADGHLHESEWREIRHELLVHGKALGATAARCRDALEASTGRFRRLREAGPDAVLVHFRECVDALHAGMSDGPGREGLLRELWQLAGADGVIDAEERAILDELEARWLSQR